VQPLRKPWLRAALWSAFATVVIVVLAALFGTRTDIVHALGEAKFVIPLCGAWLDGPHGGDRDLRGQPAGSFAALARAAAGAGAALGQRLCLWLSGRMDPDPGRGRRWSRAASPASRPSF